MKLKWIVGLVALLQLGCVARHLGRPKVVNSPPLDEREKGISLQLMSTSACEDGKIRMYQCSGIRIHDHGFVSAGHCYKPERKYYLLSSYEQMIELRKLSDDDGEGSFQSDVPCEKVEDYLREATKVETAVEIKPKNVFVSEKYIERIPQKTSSPIKMVFDFAVVRLNSPVLTPYPKFLTGKVDAVEAETPVKHYGTGLTNCFVVEDGETRKVRSSKLEQSAKMMGVGRVDATFISEEEKKYVIRTEYHDSKKQKETFTKEAEYLQGLIFLRNQVNNFPCGGDSGSGYIYIDEEDNERVIGIHRASVYDHVETPYSIGVRLDSSWSCERFQAAELEVEACQ